VNSSANTSVDAPNASGCEYQRKKVTAAIKSTAQWDVLVIGGGITGAGIAREAARQGLKVLVLEQKDFAWGTSSRSSKMVHGGLRYLAAGNLKLTSHSVKERERLMCEAPGLVDLQTFSWPHYKKKFPGPFVFNSLLAIYDFFAGKRYRKFINKQQTLFDLPGINSVDLLGATQFADAVTDDARLVMRVLQEAQDDGAHILNYCGVKKLIKRSQHVTGVNALDHESGEMFSINARVVVSATGAWADQLRAQLNKKKEVRPLRGSHLVFPNWRLPCSQAISLSHPEDGRSMFMYSWEGMTVVGTTDLDNPEVDLSEPFMHTHEAEYLIAAVNTVFPNINIKVSDAVSSFAGVRPIVSQGGLNPSAEKRDHTIWDDQGLVTVSGGKLTTFRLIALDTLKVASKYLENINVKDKGEPIFRQAGTIPKAMKKLGSVWTRRLNGFYGVNIKLLCECANDDWSMVPGSQTYWAQLKFSAQHEQVVHLDDLLLRRTRVGQFLNEGGIDFQPQIREICQQALNWNDDTWQQEWTRYLALWQQAYSVPLLKHK
jgi:glycerol-3-phosphate dehydrogenase